MAQMVGYLFEKPCGAELAVYMDGQFVYSSFGRKSMVLRSNLQVFPELVIQGYRNCIHKHNIIRHMNQIILGREFHRCQTGD